MACASCLRSFSQATGEWGVWDDREATVLGFYSMWRKMPGKGTGNWCRLGTKRQACDCLTCGNTQTQTRQSRPIGSFAWLSCSLRGRRSGPDPASGGRRSFLRGSAGNGGRRGSLAGRDCGEKRAFSCGLWRRGWPSVERTRQRSLPRGADRQPCQRARTWERGKEAPPWPPPAPSASRTQAILNVLAFLSRARSFFFFLIWIFFFFKCWLNLLQYCFCFMSWLLGQEAGGVLVPRPGIQPVSPCTGRSFLLSWIS